MMRVYCSGPLFSPEERETMQSIEHVLAADGFETFLPQRDGLEDVFVPLLNSPLNIPALGLNKLADRSIFRYDVFQLVHRCDVLVMNMNGRVPDEGACVEAGMAFALGKPVVLYKNDARTAFAGLDNAMISGLSVLAPVPSIAELPDAVRRAHAEVEKINGAWRFDHARLAPFVLEEARKGESAQKMIRAVKPG